MKDNYDACFEHVLGSEGGYTNDSRDRGNWTTGVIGKGQLKGTKWGVSAMSYPDLDIKNLTQDDAKRIYKRDYWDRVEGDLLPAGVDLCTFDSSVNSGVGQGAKWLQRAVGVAADGDIGQATVEAVQAADDHLTINRMSDDRLNMLKGLKTWPTYGKGWSTRVENVRKTAHKMVAFPSAPEPEPVLEPIEPEPTEITLRVTAPRGVTVRVVVEQENT